MVGEYAVFLGNDPVGTVSVNKKGLYYQIECQCKLSGSVICKLTANWEDKAVDIGILAPEGDGFVIRSNLPIKRAGEGTVSFHIKPKHQKLPESFVPIRADEPFAYLSMLEKAYLCKIEGNIGIVIPEALRSSQPGNDLSP